MDGFPNGRRLEDDVTRIELQAVGGIVLSVLGLWYDDFNPGQSPVTPNLVSVLTYNTGIGKNDADFRDRFPFEAAPWAGTHICNCDDQQKTQNKTFMSAPVTTILGMAAPEVFATASPNPVVSTNRINYTLESPSQITISVTDIAGKSIKVLTDKKQQAGTYNIEWNAASLAKGSYFITIMKNGMVKQTLPLVKAE
jgi:hypothetical protein